MKKVRVFSALLLVACTVNPCNLFAQDHKKTKASNRRFLRAIINDDLFAYKQEEAKQRAEACQIASAKRAALAQLRKKQRDIARTQEIRKAVIAVFEARARDIARAHIGMYCNV